MSLVIDSMGGEDRTLGKTLRHCKCYSCHDVIFGEYNCTSGECPESLVRICSRKMLLSRNFKANILVQYLFHNKFNELKVKTSDVHIFIYEDVLMTNYIK